MKKLNSFGVKTTVFILLLIIAKTTHAASALMLPFFAVLLSQLFINLISRSNLTLLANRSLCYARVGVDVIHLNQWGGEHTPYQLGGNEYRMRT